MTYTPDATTTSDAQALEAQLQQTLEQVFELGLNHHQNGQIKEAEDLYRTILEFQPGHPDASHNLGVLMLEQQPAAALEHFRLALVGDTEREQFWLSYVEALLQAGEVDVARKMLALGRQSGLSDEATAHLTRRFAKQMPECPGQLLQATPVQALDTPQPSKKQLSDKRSKKKSKGQPGTKDINRVMDLLRQGRSAEIEKEARALMVRFPEHGFGWKVLGAMLYGQDKPDEAVLCMEKAVSLLPGDAEVRCNLATTLREQGRLSEADILLHQALTLKPDLYLAISELAALQLEQGRHDEAIQNFRRALSIQGNDATVHHQFLYGLLLSPGETAAQIYADHLAFGERFEKPLRAGWQAHSNSKAPQRCLQIGFVSGDFYNHAISNFIEPILVSLAKDPELSLHAYYTYPREDDVTKRLQTYFTHWSGVVGLSDDELANKVRADGIDILIDLSGHTSYNRLLTFARKPAPIQVSWMGYPGTTGLQAMDYYQSDRFFTPPGLLDDQFIEKLVQLPALTPFQISTLAPPVNELPALRKGHITFGSFNRVNKIGHPVVALWAQVLRAIPDAHMLLGGMPTDENTNIRQWFEDEGIETSRLQLHPKTNIQSYLALHHQVDICLDTFPYNGGTTTMLALSMGVPTLTMTGQTAASRAGACNLGQVGLDDFVTYDQESFVQRAAHWANHLAELSHIRANLRQQFAQSPAGQPDVIAACVAQAWRTMWQRWCSGLPAQSFEVALRN